MKAGWGKAYVLVICAMLASALPAAYAKEKSKHSRSVKAADQGIHAGVEIFVGKDREVIRQYFRDHAGNLPPGLAKRRGALPPGLEKQLRRRGHLPPGLEKKVAVFPVELERRLPPLKPGLTRGFLEGKAVIMDERTSVILDIFTIF